MFQKLKLTALVSPRETKSNTLGILLATLIELGANPSFDFTKEDGKRLCAFCR